MKTGLCRLFAPWRAEHTFDDLDAYFAFLVRYNKVMNAIRVILFAAAAVLLIVGYAVDDGAGGYSIAAIATHPFYLIAVAVLVAALGASLVIIQNEKQLPQALQQK